MLTVEHIKAAHSKVKSGADFPAYIKEITALGVSHYEAYVCDGHIDYHGPNSHSVTVPEKYALLKIADKPLIDEFKEGLLAHQKGKTDYLTFITMCAAVGIEKWTISIEKMTCTYYDTCGNEVLVEQIPQ